MINEIENAEKFTKYLKISNITLEELKKDKKFHHPLPIFDDIFSNYGKGDSNNDLLVEEFLKVIDFSDPDYLELYFIESGSDELLNFADLKDKYHEDFDLFVEREEEYYFYEKNYIDEYDEIESLIDFSFSFKIFVAAAKELGIDLNKYFCVYDRNYSWSEFLKEYEEEVENFHKRTGVILEPKMIVDYYNEVYTDFVNSRVSLPGISTVDLRLGWPDNLLNWFVQDLSEKLNSSDEDYFKTWQEQTESDRSTVLEQFKIYLRNEYPTGLTFTDFMHEKSRTDAKGLAWSFLAHKRRFI